MVVISLTSERLLKNSPVTRVSSSNGQSRRLLPARFWVRIPGDALASKVFTVARRFRKAEDEVRTLVLAL